MVNRFGLAALVAVAVWVNPASADADITRQGQTDQNEPIELRLTQTGGIVRTRLLLRCEVMREDYTAPVEEFKIAGVSARVRRIAGRRVAARYRARRHRHPNEVYGLVDSRSAKSFEFAGTAPARGVTAGTIRMQRTDREVRTDSEVESPYELVRNCDSGTRRWRVPRLAFSGPWRPTPPAVTHPTRGKLVALGDGNVLLIGDEARPQLYDAHRNRWKRTRTRGFKVRAQAAVSVVSDGRVLVAGGVTLTGSGDALDNVDIYDPVANAWTRAAPLRLARSGAASVLLRDGRVLVAGGTARASDGGVEAATSVEIYDPSRDSWQPGPSMPQGITRGRGWLGFYSTRLRSGTVLVVGDREFESYATNTLFDPRDGSWTPSRRLPGATPDNGIAAGTKLRDGRVLVVTNCGTTGSRPRAALYSASSGWKAVARPPFCGYALATLRSGRVLMATTPRAALYDPTSDRWTLAPTYRFPHATWGATFMGVAPTRGGALVIGDGLDRFTSAERFFEP